MYVDVILLNIVNELTWDEELDTVGYGLYL